MMKQVFSLIRLPWSIKKLLPEAFLLSGYYRLVLLKQPFSKIALGLGEKGKEQCSFSEIDTDRINAVKTAVSCVCKHTPWESKCFVQALTAKSMLARRRIPGTLYFGLRKAENGAMSAHAWIKCGDIYVAGGRGDAYHTTIECYGWS